MSTIIYLARPIDQANAEQRLRVDSWEETLTDDLRPHYTVYRPAQAWATTDPDPRIESVNRAALRRADCVVAILPGGVPTLGVPAEIEAAINAGTPVVILGHHRDPLPFVGRPGVFLAVSPSQVLEIVHTALEFKGTPVVASPTRPSPFGYPLKVTRVEEDIDPAYHGAVIPSRTYEDDAGLDLYATKQVTIYDGKFEDIPCGIAIELPYWSWGLITGRSSSLRKRGLQVQPGIIDVGYRGPLYTMVLNTSGGTRVVMPGERLGQLIIMYNHTRSVDPQMADELSDSLRGINGFGSSGV